MVGVITRDEFIELCPIDLKKRIDDFLVFYSQKKKTSAFTSGSDTGKKFYKNDGNKYENKKNTMSSFKKPFEKSETEFEKVLNNFKGTLSKINENNNENIWTEILGLHLEKYAFIPAPQEDDGWSVVTSKTNTNATNNLNNSKDISLALYQYSRNCHMYIKQYIDLIKRMHKTKNLVCFSNNYVELLLEDLDNPKSDNRVYNTLTHSICCELFSNNLVTKKTFIEKCIVIVFDKIVNNMENDTAQEYMEIIIQNMSKCGNLITNNVGEIMDELKEWAENKTFSGKIHYNLIDLVELMESW